MTDNRSQRQVLKLNKTMMAELEAEYRDARMEALHTIMALTYPQIAAAVRRFLLAGRPRDEVAAWRNHTALRELLTEYHLDLAQRARARAPGRQSEFERGVLIICKTMPKAASSARGKKPDENRATTMVEELANCLGVMIALTSGRDPKVTDKVLEAATQKVFEAASDYDRAQSKLARGRFGSVGRS